MKREIKFRGKAKKDGEWFYGNLFDKDTSGRTHISTITRGCLDIDPNTVGQYTGLKDKNGKEIYEGDILRSDTYPFSCMEDGIRDNYFGEVYWEDEGLSWALVSWKNPNSKVWGISHGIGRGLEEIKPEEFEVIGNIHDNPELTGGSQS